MVTVASVDLPAGNFTLHGSATFTPTGDAPGVSVACSFLGFVDIESDGLDTAFGSDYGNIAVDNDLTFGTGGGTVNWQCRGSGTFHVTGHLVAIQVAALH